VCQPNVCPRCHGHVVHDGDELWCVCGAQLEIVDGELREFRRPTIQPEEDEADEVFKAAVEAGTYEGARKLLRKRRGERRKPLPRQGDAGGGTPPPPPVMLGVLWYWYRALLRESERLESRHDIETAHYDKRRASQLRRDAARMLEMARGIAG
jgi:hypothetical protein